MKSTFKPRKCFFITVEQSHINAAKKAKHRKIQPHPICYAVASYFKLHKIEVFIDDYDVLHLDIPGVEVLFAVDFHGIFHLKQWNEEGSIHPFVLTLKAPKRIKLAPCWKGKAIQALQWTARDFASPKIAEIAKFGNKEKPVLVQEVARLNT